MTPQDYITAHAPCNEAAAFLRSFPTVAEAWDACTRPDWLIWAARRLGANRPADTTFRRIACRCVRETPLHDGRKVWDLLKDERSRRAVEVAEAHTRGEATDNQLADAASAAAAYAAAEAYAAAAYAAYAAAAYAAYAAYEAAASAAAAAAAYAAAAAQEKAQEKARAVQCQIIRSEIANPFRA
jgi:hypothetical protein